MLYYLAYLNFARVNGEYNLVIEPLHVYFFWRVLISLDHRYIERSEYKNQPLLRSVPNILFQV